MQQVSSKESRVSGLVEDVRIGQYTAAVEHVEASSAEMSLLRDAAALEREYIERGRSTYDIARWLGCNAKTVHSALRRHGIPTRPRGQNLKGDDNYMRPPGVVNPFLGRRHTVDTRKLLSERARADEGRAVRMTGRANPMYGRRGKDSPGWRGGCTPNYLQGRTRSELRQWRERVLARDGHRCRICGRTDDVEVHHLLPYLKYPDLRAVDDNGVVLCTWCHARLDGYTQDVSTGKIVSRETRKRPAQRSFVGVFESGSGGP